MSARLRFAVAAVAALGLGLVQCSGDEYTGVEVFGCPDKQAFIDHVSPYMERRCGTLDCHGSSARPMRLYGQLGHRHPAESNVAGGIATTAFELESNYVSVCDVDPEPMAEATKDFGSSAEKLLFIQKARGVEGHKGGKIVNELDAGDRCLVGWIRRVPAAQLAKDCDEALRQLD